MNGWVKAIVLVGMFFLVPGIPGIACGENIEDVDLDTITADALEANPDLLNSTFSEIPEIPPMPIVVTEDAMIEGTGNVSDVIELENAHGDYSVTILEINGTDDTEWGYQKIAIEDDYLLYTGVIVSVVNATRFDLEGYAETPEQNVSFSGIRHHDWGPDPLFSASAIVLNAIEDNQTIGWGLTDQLTGSVEILNRVYHIERRPRSDSVGIKDNPFEMEWDLQPRSEAQVQSDVSRKEGYSAAYMSMDSAELSQRMGYAFSTPYGTNAIQYADITSGTGIIYLLSEDLLLTDTYSYNAAFEELEGYQMLNTAYQGTTSSINNTSRLTVYFNGNSNGTIQERKISLKDKESPSYEFRETGSNINATKGLTTIPASLSGKSQIVTQTNKNIILSQYGAQGGIIHKGGPDDECFAFAGDNEVLSNLTVGSGTSFKISSLTGQETLAIDGNRGDTTRIAGAWTIKTPETIPYIRWAVGSNGVKYGYLNEAQTDRIKVIKESVKADKTGVFIT